MIRPSSSSDIQVPPAGVEPSRPPRAEIEDYDDVVLEQSDARGGW